MADATQTGVSNEQDGKKIDTENLEVDPNNLPARLRSMESIKVNRDDDEPSQADQQLAAQLGAEQDPTPAPSGPKVITDGLDQMLVTVKIDGRERQVTVEEMQRQFQKNGAAEARLEEATRLLNEARATAHKPAAPPVGIADPGGKPDSTNAPEGGDDGAKAFLSSLFEGDEEKATEALNRLLGGRNQVPIQPNEQELAAKLTPVIRQQMLQESALEKFESDFSDVMADPYLETVAAGFIQEAVDGGTPFIEALEIGGNKTRDWIASMAPKADPGPTPTMTRDAKLERKARIDQIPTLNKAASSTVEPTQTTADVIAEMRKARGLA